MPADSSSCRLDWLLTAARSESVSVLALLIPSFNRQMFCYVCLFIYLVSLLLALEKQPCNCWLQAGCFFTANSLSVVVGMFVGMLLI